MMYGTLRTGTQEVANIPQGAVMLEETHSSPDLMTHPINTSRTHILPLNSPRLWEKLTLIKKGHDDGA